MKIKEAANEIVRVAGIATIAIGVGLPPAGWALGAIQEATYMPNCTWIETPAETPYARLLQAAQKHGACTVRGWGLGASN